MTRRVFQLTILLLCCFTLTSVIAAQKPQRPKPQRTSRQTAVGTESKKQQPAEEADVSVPDSDPDPRLVEANTDFGLRLFAKLAEQDQGKNLFLSPLSIAQALAMTYNGARGETRQAMAQALGLAGLSLPEMNQGNAALLAAVHSPLMPPNKASDQVVPPSMAEYMRPGVRLSIANSLWANRQIPLKPDFIQCTRQFYQAEVTNLLFTHPAAVPRINEWISKKTEGKITDMIQPGSLSADTRLVLVNAIYFKGGWLKPFKPDNTKDGTFTLADGRQKQCPMMTQEDRFQYAEDEDFQAVCMRYRGFRTAMYLFLPKAGTSLEEFQKRLNRERWNEWLYYFTHTPAIPGTLTLPRFKAEYNMDLRKALTALGMGVAFTSRADFSGMCAGPAWINRVQHKTFLEVNEKGTEAAGATFSDISTGIGPPPQTFTMVVDRPFFLAIRDTKTDALLFLSSIADPQ